MSQHEGWFFWFLRRFNTVLCTLIGLLVLLWIGALIWREGPMLHAMFGPRFRTETAAQKGAENAKTFVENADNIQSSDTVYGPHVNTAVVLTRSRLALVRAPYVFESMLDPNGQVANLMVIDEKTGEGHWLFTGTGRNILTRDAVYEGTPTVDSPPAADRRPLIGLVMWVVEKDTDKDGALTRNDAATLYFWRKGETQVTKLLSADIVLSIGQVGADRYLVIYKNGKKAFSSLYSVPDFKPLRQTELPEAPR